MMMSRAAFIVLAATLITGTVQAANILTNGDFNTGDFSSWWTWVPPDTDRNVQIEPGSGYSFDGTDNARIWSAADWGAGPGAIGQTVDMIEGTSYSFSFDYSARWTESWGSADWLIKYYDSAWGDSGWEWGELYHESPAPNLEGEWLSFSQDFVAPAGAAHADFQIRAYNWTTVYVDNVVVTPEPASLVLLGLGGLVLRRRRP